jgi:hypothetical protein
MAGCTWREQIRPGHKLWREGWSVTIGGLMGRRKSEPGKTQDQKPEPSGKSTEPESPSTLSQNPQDEE